MGIRYYAWPLSADHVEAARREPGPFLADDPLAQAWSTANEGNCYLDKAWRGLQLLIASSDPRWTDRPAAALVAGQVTFVDYGWEPHIGVLDPGEVSRAAADLAVVAANIPLQWRPRRRKSRARTGPGSVLLEQDYINQYLGVLKEFADTLVERRKGMIYMIG